jgi:hypothetical protein
MNVNLRRLRELNFHELISVGVVDPCTYTFSDYEKAGYVHSGIAEYCVSCESKGCHVCPGDSGYRLTNISHGAHSTDYFLSLEETPDLAGWHSEPVVFVYESPSLDYDIYADVAFHGQNKRPSKQWYWIHTKQIARSFPYAFKGGEYGQYVFSACMTRLRHFEK